MCLACCSPGMLLAWHAACLARCLPGMLLAWHAACLACCVPGLHNFIRAEYLACLMPGTAAPLPPQLAPLQVDPGAPLPPKLVAAAAVITQGTEGWHVVRQGRGTGTRAHKLAELGHAVAKTLSATVSAVGGQATRCDWSSPPGLAGTAAERNGHLESMKAVVALALRQGHEAAVTIAGLWVPPWQQTVPSF